MSTPCEDCGEVITAAEVTGPDGRRFVSEMGADLAVLTYRPEDGYTVRTVTGRSCERPANHW